MPVDEKGKKILKAASYDKFRKEISRAVAEYIRDQGKMGEDIQTIVDRVLKEDRFKRFFESIVERTQEITNLSRRESENCASMLVSEETSAELQRKVPRLVCREESLGQTNQIQREFYKKLQKGKILKGRYQRAGVLKFKPKFSIVVSEFVRKNSALMKIVGVGIFLIALSMFLLGSVYDSLIVALTLNAVSASSLGAKLGNVIGALGGVLLFFTTISIIVSHFLERERKRELLTRLANEYLEKSR